MLEKYDFNIKYKFKKKYEKYRTFKMIKTQQYDKPECSDN